MNRTRKIIVGVFSAMLVLVAIIGITYAYFVARVQGNTSAVSITTKAGILSLVYGEGQNDVIEATNILPGYTNTKNFTVTNNGSGTASYGVFLEELRNTFSRTEDLKITITCTSNVENKECNGLSQSNFPTQNDLLITNSIDKDEVQTYTLTLEYLNANENQNADNNASLFAKVQIYDLDSTVDLEGTVTNSQPGDYVVVNSSPKRSEIIDGKFKVVGLEPGNHTIEVYNSSDIEKVTSNMSIELGEEENVADTVITVVPTSRVIETNIDVSTSEVAIKNVSDGLPHIYLADTIIENAKNITDEQKELLYAEYSENPKTTPAVETSGFKYVKAPDPTGFGLSYRSNNALATSYYTYADDYTLDENTGLFTLVNPKVDQLQNIYTTLPGKYIVNYNGFGSSNSTIAEYANVKYIRLVGPNTTFNTVFSADVSKGYIVKESVLSKSIDDYGDTYYFRGGVKNNYVDFANMCWRIVRIEGDNSVKLILEDKNKKCENIDYSNGDGNWNLGYSQYGCCNNETVNNKSYSHAKYDSEATYSQMTVMKEWYNSNILNTEYDKKLKEEYVCVGATENLYDKDGVQVDNLSSTGYIYYDNYKRLIMNSNPSFKCNGSKPLISKAITITADEVMFAGGKFNSFNQSYYLINSYQIKNTKDFWTSNVSRIINNSSRFDQIFSVDKEGTVIDTSSAGSSGTMYTTRPVVTLKKRTEIMSGGDGSQSNPYVIK